MDDVSKYPEIDYLAKDYASFRQLMLDHLTLTVPDWNEQSEADVGNVLVEILAYAADYLSYYQDAVATEAYLGTARLRTSIKRHVRLLDYVLHQGCNARAWVQVQVNAPLILPQATQLLTQMGAQLMTISPRSIAYEEALSQQPKVFETMHSINLFPEHNTIRLYVGRDEEATLEPGCTSATLCEPEQEHQPKQKHEPEQKHTARLRLKPGDVLIFEEVKNATTGATTGVDITRRQAVRLTGVTRGSKGSQRVVHVTWSKEDALRSPLRLAVRQQGDLISAISVARGNIVLADHGLTIRHEALPRVLSNQRYRPYLSQRGLAYAVPYVHEQALKQSASKTLPKEQDVRSALPLAALFQQSRLNPLRVEANFDAAANDLVMSNELRQRLSDAGIVLSSQVSLRAVQDMQGVSWELYDTLRKRHWLAVPDGKYVDFTTFNEWRLQSDLLSGNPLDCAYTVDVEDNGRAYLRFGFGTQGQKPQAGDRFLVTYRVGGGELGNVREDTITNIVTTEAAIIGVRNPLAAQGGVDAELIDEVRDMAPYAFREQQCCIAEEDYAVVAQRHPQVVNAVARLRWLGNAPVVCVYVQREQGQPVDAPFIAELLAFLEEYRLSGHAIEIRGPYFVGLRVALNVQLQRYALKNIVEDKLVKALSNQDGGFFAPDTFTFGQTVYQSRLIAAVMAVQGVKQVDVEQFGRFDITPTCSEEITLAPLEIARLDNNKRFPYNGIIRIQLEGGL